MEDAVHAVEERRKGALGEVGFNDREAELSLRLLDVGHLYAPGVIVREGIDADHLVAPPETRLGKM
jgi:hypothetical protein